MRINSAIRIILQLVLPFPPEGKLILTKFLVIPIHQRIIIMPDQEHPMSFAPHWRFRQTPLRLVVDHAVALVILKLLLHNEIR